MSPSHFKFDCLQFWKQKLKNNYKEQDKPKETKNVGLLA